MYVGEGRIQIYRAEFLGVGDIFGIVDCLEQQPYRPCRIAGVERQGRHVVDVFRHPEAVVEFFGQQCVFLIAFVRFFYVVAYLVNGAEHHVAVHYVFLGSCLCKQLHGAVGVFEGFMVQTFFVIKPSEYAFAHCL